MDYYFAVSRVDVLGELEVDSVKGHDQVLVIVDLLKGANNTRLTTDTPDKVLVRKSIVQTHALLVDQRQVVLVHGGKVVAIEAKLADGRISDCRR
jgi:hypothetical protein